jgi:hypothetical protein
LFALGKSWQESRYPFKPSRRGLPGVLAPSKHLSHIRPATWDRRACRGFRVVFGVRGGRRPQHPEESRQKSSPGSPQGCLYCREADHRVVCTGKKLARKSIPF